MDASDLRTFVQVIERKGFSAAAEALGLTPSAVSKLVSRLEQRLGVRLLQRTTRRLTLTPEGEAYFTRARQIVADIEDMEAEVTRSRGMPRGRLRINTSSGFGVHQLSSALPDFLHRYPDVEVELSIADRLVDMAEEQADIVIRGGHIADMPMAARKIADFRRVLCAAPAYLARHGAPRSPAELAGHVCIRMQHQKPAEWAFRGPDGIARVDVGSRVTTDNSETALRMALGGAGIIRLADMIVGDSIKRGFLVPLLSDTHDDEPVPLSALYFTGRYRLPKIRVFLDFLTERFGSAPWRVKAGGSGAEAQEQGSLVSA